MPSPIPPGTTLSVSVQAGPALPPRTEKFAELIRGMVREYGLKTEGRPDYLLMLTVHRWREAETQYTAEPDAIDMTVELKQARSATTAGQFEFHTQGARVALTDRAADRLLDGSFRRALGQLLGFKKR